MVGYQKERLTATWRLAFNRRKADEEIFLFSAVICSLRNNGAKLQHPRANTFLALGRRGKQTDNLFILKEITR